MTGRNGGREGPSARRRRDGGSRTTRAWVVASVLGLVLIAGACSSPSGGGKPVGDAQPANETTLPTASLSTSSTISVPAPTTTTPEETEAAILAAYREMWTDIAAVEGRYPVNSSDPVLTRHTAGNELVHLNRAATDLNLKGEYLAGPALDTSRAIVRQLLGAVAVVADCYYDDSVLMNGRTNQVVNPADPVRELADAEVRFIQGEWKVTEFSNVSSGCTVAS